MEPLPEISGYHLRREIGRGVFSRVFEAKPTRGHGWASCALKVLKPDFHNDSWVLSCFRRESVVGSSVRHPSLPRFVDGQVNDSPYFHACEAVAGHTLRGAALLPVPIVLDLLAQLASAVAALHRRNFVHGDIKPGNILLEPSGRAVLIDLGFARTPGSLCFDEGIPGTPNYLAPELCNRTFLDTPAADVFALGVTAFELLTGELPYPVLQDSSDVMQCHRDDSPQSLADMGDWPADLVNLVDRMLTKNVFARPKARRVVEQLNGMKREYRRVA